MSYVKALTSAYLNYYTPGKEDPDGIRLITLNGKDSKIFYKTDYNTYIPNTINYIIGLLGHLGNKRTRPEKYIFVSNKLLARNIGVSYSHASYVMDQVERIFNLEVSHEKGRGRSRTVKLSKTLIDFMKVFNEEQLDEWMDTHNIDEHDRFGVQQVHRYLGWGIAPAQLSPKEKQERKEYLSDQERRNFLHFAATSNQKPESRMKDIEEHLDKLSESQQQQFTNLKAAHTPGERLSIYWHKVLLKLQQIITWLTRQEINENQEETQTTSAKNENTNESTSVAHTSAIRVAQKKLDDSTPESKKLQFMGKVIISWNLRAERNNLPMVKRLTEQRYNSLLALMEEYTEKEILQAISKIEYVHQGNYDHKFTFERFIQSETLLYVLEYDSNSIKAVEVDVMEHTAVNFNTMMRINATPEFESIKELNTWLR